ncbi:hypothetical protein H072_5294 [Dactylellina haptotyla CBS 200.50]|uniref:Mid2 domain-containing protein n=1 Tax=Dactylellina haptotyla (strain CBS 200.50) TaxID=1284197 RepID=S8BN38_DACHA|nr:hypothetical protein H072_5294 [Dactylellina haptotyla CBS 200.50]
MQGYNRTSGFGYLWVIMLALTDLTLAASQCYFNDGTMANGYFACNENRPAGTHSPCCNIRNPRVSNIDICLESGLCLWQQAQVSNDFLFANGCTDPTGRDANCQQFCTGRNTTVYTIVPCPNGRWCCSGLLPPNGNPDCCDNSFILSSNSFRAQVISLAATATASNPPTTQSLPPVATNTRSQSPISSSQPSCPASSDSDNSVIVGASVGAVLGAALVGALATIVILWRRLQYMKRTAPSAGHAMFSQQYDPKPITPDWGNAVPVYEVDASQRINTSGVAELPPREQ